MKNKINKMRETLVIKFKNKNIDNSELFVKLRNTETFSNY